MSDVSTDTLIAGTRHFNNINSWIKLRLCLLSVRQTAGTTQTLSCSPTHWKISCWQRRAEESLCSLLVTVLVPVSEAQLSRVSSHGGVDFNDSSDPPVSEWLSHWSASSLTASLTDSVPWAESGFLCTMTRYCSLFLRLLSGESKAEKTDKEEGSTQSESSLQGESSLNIYTQLSYGL